MSYAEGAGPTAPSSPDSGSLQRFLVSLLSPQKPRESSPTLLPRDDFPPYFLHAKSQETRRVALSDLSLLNLGSANRQTCSPVKDNIFEPPTIKTGLLPDPPLARSSRPAAPQLIWNKQLLACRSSEDFAEVISRNGSSFDAVNVATAFHQIAKLPPRTWRNMQLMIPQLFKRASFLLDSDLFNAQALSNTLWSMAKMWGAGERGGVPVEGDQLVATGKLLIKRSIGRAEEFKAQNISNCIWALAKLIAGPVVSAVFGESDRNKPNPAYSLALKLGGVSHHKQQPDCPLLSMLSAFSEISDTVMKSFTAQNVANSLWGLAKMNAYNEVLVRRLIIRAGEIITQFNPQHLSNVIWAVGVFRSQLGRETFLKKFLVLWDETANTLISQFNVQDVCNCIWGLGRLSAVSLFVRCMRSLQDLKKRAAQVTSDCGGLYALSTLWGLYEVNSEKNITKKIFQSLLSRSTNLNDTLVAFHLSEFFHLFDLRSELSQRLSDAIKLEGVDSLKNNIALIGIAGTLVAGNIISNIELNELLGNCEIPPKFNSEDLIFFCGFNHFPLMELSPDCVPEVALKLAESTVNFSGYENISFLSKITSHCCYWGAEELSAGIWARLFVLLIPVKDKIMNWKHVFGKFLVLVYCPLIDRIRKSEKIYFDELPSAFGLEWSVELVRDVLGEDSLLRNRFLCSHRSPWSVLIDGKEVCYSDSFSGALRSTTDNSKIVIQFLDERNCPPLRELVDILVECVFLKSKFSNLEISMFLPK